MFKESTSDEHLSTSTTNNKNSDRCYLGHVESVGDDEADLTGVHGVGVEDGEEGSSNSDLNERL